MIMMWAGSDAARFWKYSWSCSVRGMPSDDGEMPDSNIRARSKGSRVSTPPGPTPSTPPYKQNCVLESSLSSSQSTVTALSFKGEDRSWADSSPASSYTGRMTTQRHLVHRRRRTGYLLGGVATVIAAGVAATSLLSAEESAGSGEVEPAADTHIVEAKEELPAAVVEPEPAPEPPFDFGECPPTAHACVDLEGERAWLQRDGEVTYDPVPIGQGGPGYETPKGTFHVSRKVEYDVSYVFDMAPMPFSVYFTNVGHAFHEGDPEGDSHGCVRLGPGHAEHYFGQLQIGDAIHIY